MKVHESRQELLASQTGASLATRISRPKDTNMQKSKKKITLLKG